MTKRLLMSLALLLVTVTACGGGGSTPSNASDAQANPIEWDRNPKTIVFRADITGGNEDPFYALSDVPPCTLYGDNHIVWINELDVNNIQVLEDRITDEQVRQFVNYVAITKQIYKYTAKADTLPLTQTIPVVETLTLFVNNVNHKTDAFGGWDYQYYQDLEAACTQVSRAPVIYVPTGAWLTVRTVDYNSDAPHQPWEAQANNLSLKDIAASGKPKWITDRNVGVFWTMLTTSPKSIQLIEDNVNYNIAIQAPGISRESPPAP